VATEKDVGRPDSANDGALGLGLVKPGWNHGGHGVAGFDRIRMAINVAFWEIGQHILCCSL